MLRIDSIPTLISLYDNGIMLEFPLLKGVKSARIKVEALENLQQNHENEARFTINGKVFRSLPEWYSPPCGLTSKLIGTPEGIASKIYARMDVIAKKYLTHAPIAERTLKKCREWQESVYLTTLKIMDLENVLKIPLGTTKSPSHTKSTMRFSRKKDDQLPFTLVSTKRGIIYLFLKSHIGTGSFKFARDGIDVSNEESVARLKPRSDKTSLGFWEVEVNVYRQLEILRGNNVNLKGLLLSKDIISKVEDNPPASTCQVIVPKIDLNLNEYMEFFSINSSEKQTLSYNLVEAVYHFHLNLAKAHRDIKPENIRVNENGEIFLCDYGTARSLLSEIEIGLPGTRGFSPPENFLHKPSDMKKGIVVDSAKWDSWSLGVCLFKIKYGYYPNFSTAHINDNLDAFLHFSFQADQPNLFKKNSSEWLIKQLLRYNPEDRMSIVDAYSAAATVFKKSEHP